jgi:knotted carbamoyltransferase YgeW
MDRRDRIAGLLGSLEAIPATLFGRDILLSWELSLQDIAALLTTAESLMEMHRLDLSLRVFESGLGVSIFRDKSTRTRYSFGAALDMLGLEEYAIDEESSQIAHGETVRETANMISFLTEVIGIRDDIYLGRGDAYMREVSEAVRYGAEKGILNRAPSIVNLQSDVDHPTQCLSDLAKLNDRFGARDNLKGRRIAVSWAYSPSYGKPLSVPQGLLGLVSRFGMDVVLAYPEGYELLPEVVDLAKRQANKSGGRLTVTHSMDEAFKDADVVYPKSWAPFRVMERRTELLSAGDRVGLADLERQCLEQNAKHREWECTDRRMALTGDEQALYMHCLPADITGVSCEAGEVSAEVFDRYMDHTYHQASFKPFVIASMILLTRVKDVADRLKTLLEKNETRRPM